MYTPNTKSKVSISIYISLLLLNIISIRELIYTYYNNLNILSYSLLYLKGVFLYISFISSKAFFK